MALWDEGVAVSEQTVSVNFATAVSAQQSHRLWYDFIRALHSILLSSTLMGEPEFDWDPAKAAQNLADHGVSFDMAEDVFKDPFALEWLDDREDHGEDR